MASSTPFSLNIFTKSFIYQPLISDLQVINTIDTHTGGEPLRIITNGLPHIPRGTVLEKRRYFEAHYDHLRTGLLLEPRGHADMYGAILTKSEDPDVDIDCFFLNTDGYSPMCGHAILAITKVVLETGVVSKNIGSNGVAHVNIAVPAGIVFAEAEIALNGQVIKSSFDNVPSFIYLLNQKVSVPGFGAFKYDIAFGGAFYAFVDAEESGIDLGMKNLANIVKASKAIKKCISESVKIAHPLEPDLSFLFGVIFIGKPFDKSNHSRNVNVFEDGQVDRSSTGTGVSARAALHFAKGELKLGESITIESIVGSTMTVEVVKETVFEGHKAVIPKVSGQAHITGTHDLYFQPEDPFKAGFLLRS